jgi:hypothetical protein
MTGDEPRLASAFPACRRNRELFEKQFIGAVHDD